MASNHLIQVLDKLDMEFTADMTWQQTHKGPIIRNEWPINMLIAMH